MAITGLLLLILVLDGTAWAAEPDTVQPENTDRTAPVQGPHSPATPRAPSTKQQLRELDRRLNVLESLAVGSGHKRGVMERGLGWSPEIKERGFSLYSTDGNNRLHLNGGIQADYHGYPGGQTGHAPGAESDGFVLRRVRPILDFRIANYFRGQIMPDLAPRRRSELFNAFIDWDYYDWARVRVGQFKPVLNVENQQGEFDLVFAERSLVQNFALRRDFGANVTGRILDRHVRYDLGVFNSNNGAIGSASVPEPSVDNDKLGMARVMVTPFLLKGPRAFRQFDIGVGVLYGACTNSACQQPMYTMGQDRIVFQYQPAVTGNGFETKVLPQMTWFYGRLGVMATFIHTWEPKIDKTTGKAGLLQNEAWMAQAEVAVTDDEPAFIRVTPRQPFDLSKKGRWGAWTVAARYSEQRIDPQAFGLNFADTAQYVRTTKATSFAVNWYASREFRYQWIWEHSEFQGANQMYAAPRAANMLIFRFTLIY
ncbi:MAG: hypothetical protein EPO61_15305 [Nitrospirae bacterium]|nr:MAG: hypothetical protein EPO61_15305 [Nitrospirota bacterium]